MVWEDAPKDEGLTVHESLPPLVGELAYTSVLGQPRQAWGATADGAPRVLHFCQHCNGWIEGTATQYSVNTLDSSRLAGRRGTEYYCRRCGREIAFSGMMS